MSLASSPLILFSLLRAFSLCIFAAHPLAAVRFPQLQNGPPTTNEAMTQMLLNHGSICTESVVKAFRAVDRGFFIDPPDDGRNEEVRYINMPFRNGVQHLSAPGIYGTAIEALDLREGLSFLNVCSGTGYFSALACQILGTRVRARAKKEMDSTPALLFGDFFW